MAFLVLAAAFNCAAEDDSDERIRRMIVMSNFYIDNPDAAYRMFMNARRRCGTDTNRFARLLAEVAQTNNAWVAQDAILSLSKHQMFPPRLKNEGNASLCDMQGRQICIFGEWMRQ